MSLRSSENDESLVKTTTTTTLVEETFEFKVPERPKGSMEKPLKVWELTELIKGYLEGTFADIVIIGEVSNFKPHPSGHYYFSLKDDKASITAVMFRGDNSKLKFKVSDGQRVIAVGRVSVYAPRGNYQIIVSRLEPDGIGALQLAFEQLKRKLEAEGFFDIARKRPLPLFPRKVGIVTSPSGAAIRDMLQILERRFASLPILIYPVKVQGEGAAREIAQAIRDFNQCYPDCVDVLIVGRGGGSIEDLWAFNEEIVARAIFESKIPVISAVGHEIDFTIADFVADLRAPTPSAAAELVIQSKLEILNRLDSLVRQILQVTSRIEFASLKVDDLVQRLLHALTQKLNQRSLILERLKGRLAGFAPQQILATYRQSYEHLVHRLLKSPAPKIERLKWKIEGYQSKLKLLNPRAIMERGYSIVRIEKTGKVVTKVSDVRMGDKLLIEVAKGKITAKV